MPFCKRWVVTVASPPYVSLKLSDSLTWLGLNLRLFDLLHLSLGLSGISLGVWWKRKRKDRKEEGMGGEEKEEKKKKKGRRACDAEIFQKMIT
jgi:hypothetical protein